MRQWMHGMSPYFSMLALLVSLGTAGWIWLVGHQDTSTQAIRGYSFSSPEDAMRSVLTMRKNGEFTALRSFDVAFNSSVIDEKLSSLKVHQIREYDGRRILFLSYKERGDDKYATEAYIRDAESGFWGPTRYEYYDVQDQALASEMRNWLAENSARQVASAGYSNNR